MEDRLKKTLTYSVIVLTVLIMGLIVLMLRDVFFDSGIPENPAEQALVQAEARVKKSPKDADALFARAKAYADMGRTNAAIKDLENASGLRPGAPMLHYTIALIYLNINNEKKAVEELNKELKVTDNRNELAWFQLGKIYSKKKEYNQAIACFKSALLRMEAGADVHYDLGQAYEGLGQYQLAAQEYKEVLKYIPDHAEAQAALQAVVMKATRPQTTTKVPEPKKK